MTHSTPLCVCEEMMRERAERKVCVFFTSLPISFIRFEGHLLFSTSMNLVVNYQLKFNSTKRYKEEKVGESRDSMISLKYLLHPTYYEVRL